MYMHVCMCICVCVCDPNISICSTPCGASQIPFSPSGGGGNLTNQFLSREVTTTTSIEETHDWLIANRYTSHLSLFANYTGTDLLRLSRKDLTELCGAADGIRLYNALRSRTVRTVYVCLEHEKGMLQCVCVCVGSVYQQIGLELSLVPRL